MEARGVPKLSKSQGEIEKGFLLEPPRPNWVASEYGLKSYLETHSGRGCACMKASEGHQWEGLGHQKASDSLLGVSTIC